MEEIVLEYRAEILTDVEERLLKSDLVRSLDEARVMPLPFEQGQIEESWDVSSEEDFVYVEYSLVITPGEELSPMRTHFEEAKGETKRWFQQVLVRTNFREHADSIHHSWGVYLE